MAALDDVIESLGGSTAQAANAGRYGTPSKLLDNLRGVESGGDPYAVNPTSKAIGAYQFTPDTVATLARQGIKFNPFDEQQSRDAADQYIQTLRNRRGGDYRAAMADYGGFIKADPKSYQDRVLNGVDLSASHPAAAQPTSQPSGLDDVISSLHGAKPTGQVSYQEPPLPKQETSLLDQAGGWAGKALGMLNPAGDFQKSAREGLASLATGAGAAVAGGAGALYEGLKNPTDEAGWKRAADIARGITEQYTYQPKSEGAKTVLQSPWSPMQALASSTEYLGSSVGAIADKLGASPETSAKFATAAATIPNAALAFAGGLKGAPAKNVPMRGTPAAWNKPPEPIVKPGATTGNSALGSVGAAGRSASDVIASDLQTASPHLQAQFANKDLSTMTPDQAAALSRHLDADKLLVPGNLTEGQAAANSTLKAEEFNNRRKVQGIADRYEEQNQNLKANIDAVHDAVAPDVPMHETPAAYGRMVVDDLLKTHDANHAAVQARYQALKTAAGDWQAPIDGVSLANTADTALRAANAESYVPRAIRQQLDQMREGQGVTFGNYENFRTNLANEVRHADHGSVINALNIVRDAAEQIPLVGELQHLKPLADAARAAAKAEFDLEKTVPAYGDVANAAGDPAYRNNVTTSALERLANRVIERRVINGGANDLNGMISLVGEGGTGHQAMSAAMLNYLRKSGSLTNGEGIFRQAGYNKALANQAGKMHDLFGENGQQLERIGRVGRLQQEQGTGGVFMNSGSGIAVDEAAGTVGRVLSDAASKVAEAGAALATGGKSAFVIGPIKDALKANKLKKAESAEAAAKTDYARRVLEPGAGVRLRDIGTRP